MGTGNDYRYCPECYAITKAIYWVITVHGYGTPDQWISAQCPVCQALHSPPPFVFVLDPDYTAAIAQRAVQAPAPEPAPLTPAQERVMNGRHLPAVQA